MAATVVVMLARNLQFLFFSCVLSFTTTTFLQLSHFSQELSSGFQQRGSNFLDLPAPLPAPSVSPESLIQFRRLRSFAKQFLWDRFFQQLPNSINRAHPNPCYVASTMRASSRMTLHPTPHPNPCYVASTMRASSRMTLHPTPPPQPLFKDGHVMRKEVKVQVGFQPVGINIIFVSILGNLLYINP